MLSCMRLFFCFFFAPSRHYPAPRDTQKILKNQREKEIKITKFNY